MLVVRVRQHWRGNKRVRSYTRRHHQDAPEVEFRSLREAKAARALERKRLFSQAPEKLILPGDTSIEEQARTVDFVQKYRDQQRRDTQRFLEQLRERLERKPAPFVAEQRKIAERVREARRRRR